MTRHIVPLYFGPEDSLFGVLNPVDGPARRGVLICAPIGYENVIYHRQLAVLARRIAQKGAPTFRFDWPGCGDSAGDDDDPELVTEALASIDAAARVLAEHAGVEAVDVVGLRFGATLLGCAPPTGGGDIVLWDAFSSGKAYLRSLRAFERLSGSRSKDTSRESAAGFLLTRETIAAIEELDVLGGDLGSPRRVLLAHRDGASVADLADHLTAVGHDVTTLALDGLREVALGWAERPVPISSFAAIESWLGLPADAAAAASSNGNGGVSRFSRAGSLQLAGGVVEQPVLLTDGSPMLGIVDTPPSYSSDGPSLDGSWVVFVPNRYARRIGPNRLYSRWARRWAHRGLPSFRVDVNGTGDAGGPDGETDRDMYQRDGVDDVLRSLAFLREEFGGERAAIIGLCSGGYLGFHAALADPMVADVILLNPQMLLWADHETSVTRATAIRSRVFRPRSWSRFMRNPITWLRFVLPVLREVVVTDLSWRLGRRSESAGGPPSTDAVEEWIRSSIKALGDRGCRLHFVFSEGDSGIGYLTRYLGAELVGLVDQPNVTFHVIEGANHSFTDLGRQDALHDLIASTLTSAGYGQLSTPAGVSE